MEIIQIFALIVLIAIVVKMLVILISPKYWLNFAGKIWKSPILVMVVSLILAGIVFYYIIQEISIVQIFAVILFVALISMATMAVYVKEFLAVAQKIVKDRNFLKRAWLPILIWIILAIWVSLELFLSIFIFTKW